MIRQEISQRSRASQSVGHGQKSYGECLRHMSALEFVHDKALYKSTFTLPYHMVEQDVCSKHDLNQSEN